MKTFLFFLLGALMSSISFSGLIEQSAKIEASDSDSNENRNKRDNLPIEEHQVTVKEYCYFLNAVATTSDSHNLYDERMGSDSLTTCITRSVTPYHYTYSVVKGKEELPIIHVSWFDQARFCNWMENGQPAASQGPEITEEGSYTLSDTTDHIVPHNKGSTYVLLSQNEGDSKDFSSFEDINPFLKSSTGFWIATLAIPKVMMNPCF
ncbi:MAG TPA: SUMF1/EgtB/PvdO family nonheme iron enzyme [Chthoniobacterales bacterium]|nr:SUMF1/EgtB/PvdO family nonheme iron enzyme [Chthoniobacterales bacterium]